MRVGIAIQQSDGGVSVYCDRSPLRWNRILPDGQPVNFTIYSQEHAIHMLIQFLVTAAMRLETSTNQYGFFPAENPIAGQQSIDLRYCRWIDQPIPK